MTEPIIGNDRLKGLPIVSEFHGRYNGTLFPELIGKTALVHRQVGGYVTAQFDDIDTGFGFGWHRFDPVFVKAEYHGWGRFDPVIVKAK